MPTEDSPPLSPAVALPTEKPTVGGSDSVGPASSFGLKWITVLLPLAYFWFRLIDNLRLEWTTNPQYAFGWMVPILCLGLVLRKWQTLPEVRGPWFVVRELWLAVPLFALLAFLYLPTRLVEEATPEWRPIQWLLGVEAIGLTLCAIWLGKGLGWLRQLAFPVAFFFVAIPWPTLIETPIIQALTRMSAEIVIELLGWVGVPAMQHGNVIEVGSGMVGIDEACSGIRSFQSSLMISLFLGEFYDLKRFRRWLLVPACFGLSMVLNIGRMFLLTLVAAKKGVAAIAQYHDPAGITIAITCTLALWGLAVWLKRQRKESSGQAPTVNSQLSVASGLNSVPTPSSPSPIVHRPSSSPSLLLPRLSRALIVWLVMVEVGVLLWYRDQESHLKPGPAWSLDFPRDNATFKDFPITPDTRYLLRFDEGKHAGWTESDGTRWQVFYCSWLPGRVAGYLAKRHTPEICLQATGLKMLSGPELTMMNIKGVELPVRSYVFETTGGPIQVFHCRWEAGVEGSSYVQQESARFNLVRAIWNGRGNKGQKVLEVIITGMSDPVQAKQALVRQLEKLIAVSPVGAPNSGSAR